MTRLAIVVHRHGEEVGARGCSRRDKPGSTSAFKEDTAENGTVIPSVCRVTSGEPPAESLEPSDFAVTCVAAEAELERWCVPTPNWRGCLIDAGALHL